MKTVQTLVGALMIASGVAGWYWCGDRGWMPLLLIGVGGFFVSQTTMKAALDTMLDVIRRKP